MDYNIAHEKYPNYISLYENFNNDIFLAYGFDFFSSKIFNKITLNLRIMGVIKENILLKTRVDAWRFR
jgi:hypothetical protein